MFLNLRCAILDDINMNPKYEPVSQNEKDYAPPVTEIKMSCSKHENRRKKVELVLAIIGCLSAVTTCIFVVAILHSFRVRLERATSQCHTTTDNITPPTSPGLIHMQYGHQYQYMSLDPQYDHLWNNYTARTAVVRLNDIKQTNDDRVQKIGAISM